MEHEGNLPPGPDDIVTSIRLPRDVHARFKAVAAREHRSLSGAIRALVDERLAREAEPEDVAA